MSTYNYVGANGLGELKVFQAPIPEPDGNQVLIKVEYSTLSPFDLYTLDRGFYVESYPFRFGVNAGGVIAKVGSGVKNLKVGDRVVATTFDPKLKGFQAYVLQHWSVVAKIPDSLSLEQAVTYPDNFVTSFYTLFNQLNLPTPTEFPSKEAPPKSDVPILIYGAGATSGQYAIQLLKLAGYKHIIATASKRHEDYLRSLGATHVIDYNSPSLAEDITKAAGGNVEYIIDCISLSSTFAVLTKVIADEGKLAYLVPFKKDANITGDGGELSVEVPEDVKDWFPKTVSFVCVRTFFYQQDPRLAETLMPEVLPKILEGKLIKPNRVRLLDHGDLLSRTKEAFELIRQQKISGEKLVVKVSEP